MGTADVSDASLVGRCAGGDHDALAELYDRYGSPAYGLALRIVRDAGLAEDAVQDAFLALWRGAARFDATRAKASTWLLSLVHHKAVDLVRREEARPSSPTDLLPERADAGDVARDALSSIERREIEHALERLPAPQREVLELAYFEGLTQSEIAVRLDEAIGTIKSRTHTALGRLRELLEPARTH